MTRAPLPGEMRALTGFRGVLVAGVVLVHLDPTLRQLLPGWSVFRHAVAHGPIVAECFFLLSGFMLFQSSRVLAAGFSPAGHARFLWSRVARLWPNHVVSALAIAAVVLAARARGVELPGEFPLFDVPFQLTMTHAWWRSPGDDWNDISWYVSSQWFAYVFLLPLAGAALARRWPPLVYAFACAALPCVWLAIAISPLPRAHFPIVRVVCAFLGGAALYGAAREAPRVVAFARRRATWVALAFVALVGTYLPYSFHALLLLAPLLVLGLTEERSAVAQLLATRPVVWLGRISFAMYLSHVVAWRALQALLPAARFADAPLGERVAVAAVHGLLIVACAVALDRFVEKPARAALDRLGARWWPAPAGARAE